MDTGPFVMHQGVSLAETEAVFHDEQRWVTMGMDAKGRLLVVPHIYRDPNFVRINSACLACIRERHQYLEA